MIENLELITKARDVLKKRKLSAECTAGEVSAAILSKTGNTYVGVNLDAGSGIGFCAEHAAIAQMVTRGESQIAKIVALSGDGKFTPPCGRCRELMYQIDRRNLMAEILLSGSKSIRLEEILPLRWQDVV
jgi:cytidine deaminase